MVVFRHERKRSFLLHITEEQRVSRYETGAARKARATTLQLRMVQFESNHSWITHIHREIHVLMNELMREGWAGTKSDVFDTLKQKHSHTVGLFEPETGRLVGMATVAILRTFHGVEARIDNVVILKEYREQGEGERLMRYVLSLAKAHHAEWAELVCGRERLPARELYRKVGFEESQGTVFTKML